MRLLILWLLVSTIAILLTACAAYPPKTIRLPQAIVEASGLAIQDSVFTWHNDSGDGPQLYQTTPDGYLIGKIKLSAQARDYEDLARDPVGRYYVGDFGNNAGKNTQQTIYRFDPNTGVTDSIRYHYPGQKGEGRDQPGNYDCEAMVYQSGYLHLFTKDQLFGKGRFYTKHFRLPATPGNYEAELVDSLYLPRRVVTAAAVDSVRGELVLTAYNFKMLLGFWPSGAASLITITDYPEGRFLRGNVRRRNLSWFIPTQFEAVDFYDERWLYVASEGTRIRKHAVGKRKRRR
ncbi:MAG: hypothetical protein AAF597_11535 [Bacteroidota bacterium]